MRRTLLTFSILFAACYSSWCQDVSFNFPVERLASRQPQDLAETYFRVIPDSPLSKPSQKYKRQTQKLPQYKPENLDNALALRYWQVMQGIRDSSLSEGAFLRKYLPIHQNFHPAIVIDKDFVEQMKNDLKVVY